MSQTIAIVEQPPAVITIIAAPAPGSGRPVGLLLAITQA